VFHLAAVLADGLAARQSLADLRAVLAPKLRGALLLDRLTAHLPLDHFVLYGSAAALLGAPGLAAYAAANAALAALAHHRRARGRPALAIDWGLFSGVGMGLTADPDGRAADRGVASFTDAEGRALLRRLLQIDLPQLGALHLDAARWLAASPHAAGRHRLSALVAEARRDAPEPAAPALLADLESAPPAERPALLERSVRAEVAAVLRLAPARLDPRQLLQDLGVDSVMGLELRGRLQRALGQPLPATLIWTYPTVEQLAAHLLTVWSTTHAPTPTPAPPPTDDLLADFDAELAALDRLIRR